MNRPSLLHIVERLEGFLGKLPETIQKPILRELTPLKELFLQQRPPRFVLTGSNKSSTQQVIETLFDCALPPQQIESHRWQDVVLGDHGTISILNARGGDASANVDVRAELNRQPADIVFFLDDGESPRGPRKTDIQDFAACWKDAGMNAKAIGIVLPGSKRGVAQNHSGQDDSIGSRLRPLLKAKAGDGFLRVFPFLSATDRSAKTSRELMSILARELPNDARVEMLRISRDREAQREVAQILVKSTAAVCTAIGAQPIPLADLPILTTLQLLMVSGIMYVSGRERSLRAATEFIGALGANVGAGMLLREGTRALLKFFPGWGNVICGMVAGAGTYAIGRSAIVFFLEGVSLKDARRVYLRSRKRPDRTALMAPTTPRKAVKRRK